MRTFRRGLFSVMTPVMIGILLTLLAAVLLVLGDSGKKHLSRQLAAPVLIWSYLGLGVAVDAVYLLLSGAPPIDWSIVGICLPLAIGFQVLGELSFLEALRRGDFSLVQPLKAFAPVLALPISYLVLGELPGPLALSGVLIVFSGAYLLYAPSVTARGLLAPLRSLFHDRAARYLIFNQICGVAIANLQKIGAAGSSPVANFTLILTGSWLLFSLYLAGRGINPLRGLGQQPRVLLAGGLIWGIGLTLVFVAVNYTLIVYVTAVNQLQPLLSMPVAYLLFKESAARFRFAPCLVMVAGVLLILFGQ